MSLMSIIENYYYHCCRWQWYGNGFQTIQVMAIVFCGRWFLLVIYRICFFSFFVYISKMVVMLRNLVCWQQSIQTTQALSSDKYPLVDYSGALPSIKPPTRKETVDDRLCQNLEVMPLPAPSPIPEIQSNKQPKDIPQVSSFVPTKTFGQRGPKPTRIMRRPFCFFLKSYSFNN